MTHMTTLSQKKSCLTVDVSTQERPFLLSILCRYSIYHYATPRGRLSYTPCKSPLVSLLLLVPILRYHKFLIEIVYNYKRQWVH